MINYYLKGCTEIKFWGSGLGYNWLEIKTDKKGYYKIKANPLQDFLRFGVEEIYYAEFEVFKEVITIKDDAVTSKYYSTPIDSIKVGKSRIKDKDPGLEVVNIDY